MHVRQDGGGGAGYASREADACFLSSDGAHNGEQLRLLVEEGTPGKFPHIREFSSAHKGGTPALTQNPACGTGIGVRVAREQRDRDRSRVTTNADVLQQHVVGLREEQLLRVEAAAGPYGELTADAGAQIVDVKCVCHHADDSRHTREGRKMAAERHGMRQSAEPIYTLAGTRQVDCQIAVRRDDG